MPRPNFVRATVLLAASFFLLGGDCHDLVLNTLCARNPDCGAFIVFVTSTEHDGDLGGLAGGDQICNSRAAAAGMRGRTFVAWLSTSSVDARDRLSEPPAGRLGQVDGWVRTDGAFVAASIADLTDGNISGLIDRDEFGAQQEDQNVWTGTTFDGKALESDCSNWTTASASFFARVGYTGGLIDGDWTNVASQNCNLTARLYCFEV